MIWTKWSLLRDKVVSTEHLVAVILGALAAEKHSTIKLGAIRDSDLSLEQSQQKMMKSIFINHSERLSEI